MDNFEEKHLDTKRGLHYRYYVSPSSQAADPSKPVLLLLHGFPDDATLWQYVISYLTKTRLRIVVPDLLGYGGTSKPTDPALFEIGGMVSDVVEILEKEKLGHNVIPVGHDWGSFIAQRFYLLETSRCAGLITLALAYAPPRPEDFDLASFNQMMKQMVGYPLYEYWNFFLAPDSPKLMESRLESLWAAMHGDVDDWMKKMLCTPNAIREFLEQDKRVPLKPFAQDEKLKNGWIEAKKESGFASAVNWYHAMAGNYHKEAEKKMGAKVEKPYLFIGCDGDPVCRSDAIELPKGMGLLADAEVHVIHSGHWCPYETPHEVGSLTVEWLKKKGFSAE